ncbi:MAG: 2-C-methyl-D-erythritol 2,4-cyclodiphosphate synthase, partial [Planctomycetaceae bacterium]
MMPPIELKRIRFVPAHHRVMTAPQLRIGLGSDIHRLVSGRPLMLGGVRIEAEFGADAHSDGDVLLHAVIDALLGAAGLGDIGEWFPNTDAKWAGADSSVMLTQVLAKLGADDWEILNMDCTISAEQPRLTPYKNSIKSRLASLMKLPPERINVKAKS